MVSFSAFFLFTTVLIREALDLLHWHFEGATMTLFHHILTCLLHLQQPALQTEQKSGVMITDGHMEEFNNDNDKALGKATHRPSAGYGMWTTFYDLDVWSREAGLVLGPPEVTPEHSFHLGDWVIWQPFLLWHLTGDHTAHCVTRFTSKPLFHYSGSQHHPPFLCGYTGPCVFSGWVAFSQC